MGRFKFQAVFIFDLISFEALDSGTPLGILIIMVIQTLSCWVSSGEFTQSLTVLHGADRDNQHSVCHVTLPLNELSSL